MSMFNDISCGSRDNEKAYVSPRPPPKISPRHDWTKELGSKVDRQAKFFQPAQPIPNPIRDRSGRPGITQDVIGVQACSSEDSKSLNVEQTHERSGRPDKDTVPVQADPEVYHEAETLNVDNETIRERIEADMDFKIPGLTTFCCETRANEDVRRDHTHHLTPQEYYYHKSNWWLRSNKTGSDTVPVQRRSDFKQALSTLQQLKEKEEGAQRNQQWDRVLLLLHGGVGKVLGGLLILMKVTMEMDQVLIEQGDLLYKYFGTILQGMIFLNSFTLLQMDRLQLTAVYCNRRVV